MPTQSATLLPESIDSLGLSIVTSSKDYSDHRWGSIYEPTNFGGASPVYFHPLSGSRYIGLFRERWTDVTYSDTNLGFATAHTDDGLPSWVVVDAISGRTQVIGDSYTIPTKQTCTTRTLESAISRAGFLYTLSTVTYGDDTKSLIQFFHPVAAGTSVMTLAQEEIIPSITIEEDIIVFNRSIMLIAPHLIFAGSDQEGRVYFARKPWARIGNTSFPLEFLTATGWHAGEDPVPTKLSSYGPISMFMWNNTMIASTVTFDEDGDVWGVVSKTNILTADVDWIPFKYFQVWLGNLSGSYLGGGLQMQPQLLANPQQPFASDIDIDIVIPYVISMETATLIESRLTTYWDLIPVTSKPPAMTLHRSPDTLGHGSLTATVWAGCFPQIQGHGGLTAFAAAIVFPQKTGHGALTAVANATKFVFSKTLTGHGGLAATAVGTCKVFYLDSTIADTNSVAIPTHKVGEIIVIFAYNKSGTIPGMPAASGTVPEWVNIDTGDDTSAARTVYFVATATNHTSGTWTDTSAMVAVVLNGNALTSPIGGHNHGGGVTGNPTAPTITMTQTDGTSALLHLFGSGYVGNYGVWSDAPTGYAKRNSALYSVNAICVDTKNVTTSDGSCIQPEASSAIWEAQTVEILAYK